MKKIIAIIVAIYLLLQIGLAIKIYALHEERQEIYTNVSKMLLTQKVDFVDQMIILVSISSRYESETLFYYHLNTVLIMITFIGIAILYKHYR